VVRDEIGRHLEQRAQLAGGGVSHHQRIDDGQSCRIAERGVHARPGDRGVFLNVHCLNDH
jgi:hypothetical protein